MKKNLALFIASTALTAALALPAWSLARTALDGSPVFAAVPGGDDRTSTVVLASSDDDDDDDDHHRRTKNSRQGDDDDDDDCDDYGDDDEGCGGTRNNPAPAGSVSPPANGLFGNGAPPVAATN